MRLGAAGDEGPAAVDEQGHLVRVLVEILLADEAVAPVEGDAVVRRDHQDPVRPRGRVERADGRVDGRDEAAVEAAPRLEVRGPAREGQQQLVAAADERLGRVRRGRR